MSRRSRGGKSTACHARCAPCARGGFPLRFARLAEPLEERDGAELHCILGLAPLYGEPTLNLRVGAEAKAGVVLCKSRLVLA